MATRPDTLRRVRLPGAARVRPHRPDRARRLEQGTDIELRYETSTAVRSQDLGWSGSTGSARYQSSSVTSTTSSGNSPSRSGATTLTTRRVLPRLDKPEIVPPTAEHVLAVHDRLHALPATAARPRRDGHAARRARTAHLGRPRRAPQRWRILRAVSKTGRARWVGVPPVFFHAVCELVPREDRIPERRVFLGLAATASGRRSPAPAPLRACRRSRRTTSAIDESRFSISPGFRGPGSASTSASATSRSRRTRTAMCSRTRPSSTTAAWLERRNGSAAQSPSTSARAASRSRSSLVLSRPTESPSLSGLTAVVCSTSTRVVDPSRSIVGRNDRDGAAVDVGETSTVESASSSSAWTTTA